MFKHSLAGSHSLHSSKSNVVKLVDFGMVLDLRKEPTARGMMGSPGFVAPVRRCRSPHSLRSPPHSSSLFSTQTIFFTRSLAPQEVILGGYHTTQMDMYSLGVLLFVMLVGAKPMTQEQAKSMQYAVMPLESLRGVHVRAERGEGGRSRCCGLCCCAARSVARGAMRPLLLLVLHSPLSARSLTPRTPPNPSHPSTLRTRGGAR